MSEFWLYALIAAIIVVISLTFYAVKLLKQLAQQKEQQQQVAKAHQQALNGHDKKVFDSILLITRAMQAEQCEFDEGCWRLSVLLASLKTINSSLVESKFSAIFALYNEIKALAILDERKKLVKKERMQQDYKRMKAEANFHDDVVADLNELHQYASHNIQKLAA